MGKADTRRINRMGYNEFDRANRQYQGFNADIQDRLAGARDRGEETRQLALDAFGRAGEGYGMFLGDRGGVNDEIWGRVTGAADALRGNANDLRAWGRNSISARDQNRMRGGGVFDEFARDGGISEDTERNLRSRGLSNVGSTFAGFREELENQSRAQGGYNPGYTGQIARMARDRARSIDDSVRDTELGIVDTRNRGRMWGAEGMAQSEGALQSQLASNRLGAYGIGGQYDSTAMQGDLGLGEMAHRGRMFGAQGGADIARGLTSLYGTAPGEEGMYIQSLLAGMSGQSNANQGNLNGLRSYNPYTDRWTRGMQIAGMAVPIASALMTGGATGAGGAMGAFPQVPPRTAFSGMGQYGTGNYGTPNSFFSPRFEQGLGQTPRLR